jgi:hypothetical protein
VHKNAHQHPPLLAEGTRGISIWWRLGVPRPFREGESLSSEVGTMVEGPSEVVNEAGDTLEDAEEWLPVGERFGLL